MANKKRSEFKRGETAPASGQYQEIGLRGGKGREVTTEKGETLPPSTKSGSTYKLVDPSKNKSGRGRQPALHV
jgi:YjzC-like protein